MKFQSLFSWNSPSDLSLRHRPEPGLQVSILVFLELALGPNLARATSIQPMSFNPCFLGTRPRTVAVAGQSRQCASFNPCFLGTRPRTVANRFKLRFGTGFNPCFLGTRPRTMSLRLRPMSLHVSILVFLELALGHLPDASAAPAFWFQSLFSWNSPSDPFQLPYSPSKFFGVSILVFLELALGLHRAMTMKTNQACFNPCFLGTRPRTHNGGRSLHSSCLVSILVFLELALGLP